MPELPEVQTTVSGLQKVLPKLSIEDIWTDWPKMFRGIDFQKTRKITIGKKIISVKRRAKNILINLEDNHTILIHMKMTGHLLYGIYELKNKKWSPSDKDKNMALRDPFNRFIHVVFSLSNNKHLVFCDTRKFGKVELLQTDKLPHTPPLSHLGPEPLEQSFTEKIFIERLNRRKKSKIKTVLMDQTVISGIGNIYSDEILWRADVHPERRVNTLSKKEISLLFKSIRPMLQKGIDFGGDSMSDYRNIFGERGNFQNSHEAYRRTGKPCRKKGCGGIILRKVVGGRSAHFCSKHQK
jgi:formamidopyrimidine-DNA glycosylase